MVQVGYFQANHTMVQILLLTMDRQKCSLELFWDKRLREVPQKLLQQSRHVMDTVFDCQCDLSSTIELVSQLQTAHNH